MKAKNKWDYIKSKMLLCRKQSIKWKGKQFPDGSKYLQIIWLIKDWYVKYTSKSYDSGKNK
jgi:hypothetical protein